MSFSIHTLSPNHEIPAFMEFSLRTLNPNPKTPFPSNVPFTASTLTRQSRFHLKSLNPKPCNFPCLGSTWPSGPSAAGYQELPLPPRDLLIQGLGFGASFFYGFYKVWGQAVLGV